MKNELNVCAHSISIYSRPRQFTTCTSCSRSGGVTMSLVKEPFTHAASTTVCRVAWSLKSTSHRSVGHEGNSKMPSSSSSSLLYAIRNG